LAVLGASLGSFFNVLIDRIPRKASIVFPASHCTSCGKKIPIYQNIPILSYLLLKGRCSNCGDRIHWHHPVVELLTTLILILLFLVHGLGGVQFYKFALMSCFLIPILFIDAFHHIIPFVLSLPLLACGLLIALIPNSGVGFINALVTSLVLFCLLYLLALIWDKVFHKEGLGGGDVVLLPGVASYFGLVHTPFVVIFACVLGIGYFVLFLRRNQVFAFGNFIAAAAIVWGLAGEQLLLLTGILT
jgi:leader peptidase (prepilin peptidase)/N-methyltransferase